MSVTPQNAQRLALWLARERPQLFALIAKKIAPVAHTLSGCRCRRGVGTFGQTGATGLSIPSGSTGMTLPAGGTGLTSVNTPLDISGSTGITGSTTPTLQPIGITAASNAGSTALTAGTTGATAGSTGGSQGFWSGFTSDIASLGRNVLPVVGQVASALTSPGVLSAVAGVASAYYANQAASTEAQTVATQIARTRVGQSPAPIAGGTLYSQNGTVTPVTSSLLSGITPREESFILPALALGAIALLFLNHPHSRT